MRLAPLVILLLVVAWLSAGAMAVRSAGRIWLRYWAERRLRGASSVLGFLDRPQRLLAAANAASALTLAAAGAWIGWEMRGTPGAALLAMLAYAAIVLVAGMIIPRVLARRWPSAFIPICMPVLHAAELLTAPLLRAGRTLSGTVSNDDLKRDEPREALQDLLREGELEGVGRNQEIAIITGVVEFGEKRVRGVMTPIADVFAVPEGREASHLAIQIAESAFSRVPVYRGSLDRIVGMYHAFDVLKAGGDQVPPLRPVATAAADTPCNELLFRMLQARQHLAVVHDDGGHTLGIATLENLLEELVGDIRDEHDEPAAESVTG
ncbi:MAG: CNNM domain-containing protein [Gemmatimonadaceae bacterium]